WQARTAPISSTGSRSASKRPSPTTSRRTSILERHRVAMFHVILFRPEIPPNTGNLIRLCANAGATLHLVHPLGFDLSDAQVRRAGLDYHEMASVREHRDLDACVASVRPERLFALTTKASRSVYDAAFRAGDAFLFGPETSGLPQDLLDTFAPEMRLRIPMRAGNRSLNLSNA